MTRGSRGYAGRRLAGLGAVAGLWLLPHPCLAQAKAAAGPPVPAHRTLRLDAAQMFDLAEEAAARGDAAHAEQVLRALSSDPAVTVRSEARFRLAQLYMRQKRFGEAAVQLRAVLD